MVEEAHCPECDTRKYVGEMEDAVQIAENHNEMFHNGDRVALVNGIKVPDFTEEKKEQIREAVSHLEGELEE